MTTKGQDIASSIKQQIEHFGMAVTMVDVGMGMRKEIIDFHALFTYL